MQRRLFVLAAPAAAVSASLIGRQALAQTCTTTTTTSTTTSGSTTTTTSPTTTVSSQPTGGIDVVAAIKSLRVSSGTYAGAYPIAPGGLFNWYFAQLGLISIVQFLNQSDLDFHIRNYLDLYLRSVDPTNFTIKDVNFTYSGGTPVSFTQVLSDSDDSYAATFLSLMTRYLRATANWTWFDANKAKIKNIAYYNLAKTIKSNGLTSVFQYPRSQTNNIGYLMDNCEVYRGLRDFASILRTRADADASYYDSLATTVANGISTRCFNTTNNAFMPGDAYTSTETSFYPGTTCQVFPQAFGVSELSGRFDAAWNWLQKWSPGWETGKYDAYPWAVLGLAAAKRGQSTLARSQMSTVENLFVNNRAMVTINELGFYQRTRMALAGAADI